MGRLKPAANLAHRHLPQALHRRRALPFSWGPSRHIGVLQPNKAGPGKPVPHPVGWLGGNGGRAAGAMAAAYLVEPQQLHLCLAATRTCCLKFVAAARRAVGLLGGATARGRGLLALLPALPCSRNGACSSACPAVVASPISGEKRPAKEIADGAAEAGCAPSQVMLLGPVGIGAGAGPLLKRAVRRATGALECSARVSASPQEAWPLW